ncbi:MAG: type II 3-dehydroquinate dehydratase [Bacteroidetes bacterium]|nr:type II 3-dehydroquinate dehydratase [Bacteroidota bacterium]MBP7398567.1 type II 3-dehydroquinate dehydratase [Chitinophagales bacterium]MBP8754512.1 type II 3-dehydroquinate dehydratase [Chitinophagales bacterium]MBP9189814.1 type II 3-dehydroquinate dehydratase [Chitinophagales bacterium]MBP9548269.1 type II 3-dehydroquinate dehydratase [Chitinophagales bacterium]
MQILIINGPNLNLLGTREPEIYGSQTFEDYFKTLQSDNPEVSLTYFQSNIEGEIIDTLHVHGFKVDGIIINAGGYSHTSVAIADAISAITAPVVAIHISNTFSREAYRHTDLIAGKCKGLICGLGLQGYALAIKFLVDLKSQI